MKRIVMIISLVLSIFILVTQETHAVLIEDIVSFDIVSIDIKEGSITHFITENGENLYEKFDDFFGYPLNQSLAYEVTIKKGPISYLNARVKHWSFDGNPMYEILFDYDTQNTFFNLRVYKNEQNISSHPALSVQFNFDILNNQGYLKTTNLPQASWQSVVGTYTISAMLESEIDPEEGISVPDVNTLPLTTGNLSDAKDSSKVGYVYFNYDKDNLFDTYIIIQGVQYNIGKLELPGVQELNKEPLNPGIYWTEGGNQYIYYEFQQQVSDKPISEQVSIFLDDPNNITGFRPFVQMNLTEKTYAFTDKLLLYAGFHDGGNGRAYADVLFPMDLDDLLSIDITYRQRWVGMWGLNKTGWTDQRVARYKDEVVHMNTTWNYIANLMVKGTYGIWQRLYDGWNETIQEITPITYDYTVAYTSKINAVRKNEGKKQLTINEVFNPDSSLYRIYLDTYYDGRYTGYEIADDIAIVDVMYQYNGEVYHVGYEDIKTDGSFGGGGGFNPLDPDAKDSLSPLSISVIVTIAIIALGLAQGKLTTKRGLNTSYVITAIVLGFLTYLIITNWSVILSLTVTVLRL